MDIQTLPSEIARLSRTAEFWNTWRVVLAALTALVAVGLFVVQHIQLRRSRQLAALQAELSQAKDRRLQDALSERDVKIADANAVAAKANRSAADAHERTMILDGQVAEAKLALAAQQERAANAEASAADAIIKATEAEANRLKLEAALMPRSLGTTYIHDEERKLFAGTSVLVVYTPDDAEAESLARVMAKLLTDSQWKLIAVDPSTMQSVAPAHPHIMPGVSLRTKIDLTGRISPFDNPARNAARVLVEQLIEQHIRARVEAPTTGQEWPSRLPPDAVLISVGPKPQDFWTQKQMEILERTLPGGIQERLRRLAADDQWSKDLNEKELERNRLERLQIIHERRRVLEQHNPHQ